MPSVNYLQVCFFGAKFVKFLGSFDANFIKPFFYFWGNVEQTKWSVVYHALIVALADFIAGYAHRFRPTGEGVQSVGDFLGGNAILDGQG